MSRAFCLSASAGIRLVLLCTQGVGGSSPLVSTSLTRGLVARPRVGMGGGPGRGCSGRSSRRESAQAWHRWWPGQRLRAAERWQPGLSTHFTAPPSLPSNSKIHRSRPGRRGPRPCGLCEGSARRDPGDGSRRCRVRRPRTDWFFDTRSAPRPPSQWMLGCPAWSWCRQQVPHFLSLSICALHVLREAQ